MSYMKGGRPCHQNRSLCRSSGTVWYVTWVQEVSAFFFYCSEDIILCNQSKPNPN